MGKVGKVHTTDVGTFITLDLQDPDSDIEVDISAASVHKILAEPPDGGAAVELDSAIVGTTKLRHIKTADTLNTPGTWILEAYVEFAAGQQYSGDKVDLPIYVPLVPPPPP